MVSAIRFAGALTIAPPPWAPSSAARQPMNGHPEAGQADVELLAEALPENVSVIRQAAMAAAEVAGLPPERVEDVALAVGEACANVVVHAYGEQRGQVALLVVASEADVDFVVRDWGGGLGPRHDSPGLGLGLPLVVALADSVQMSSGADGAHDVRMTFLCGPA